MAKDKNNMDNFLRESLGNLSAKPSQSVWKGVTKRLIILELLRLNFTNIGKVWLYSGLAAVATISGLAYFSLTHEPEEKTQTAEPILTEHKTNITHKAETNEIVSTTEEDQLTSSVIKSGSVDEPNEEIEAKLINKEKIQSVKNNLVSQPDNNQFALPNLSRSEESRSVIELKEIPQLLSGLPKTFIPENKNSDDIPGLGRAQMTPYSSLIEEPTEKTNKRTNEFNWFIGAAYNPEWPLSNEDMYVSNHQYSINGGIEYKKWKLNLGFGLRSEKTPSMYASHYLSYDSVGYFYDIDYYEINPENPDSITIYYTVENLYDSVAHQSDAYGPDQKRRWMFVPFSLGYQIHATPKYQLYAQIFGQFGWQSYIEKTEMNLQLATGSTMEDITPDANSNYLQIGIGLENSFNVFPHWWIYAEPRINYYINTPYSINQTSGNGPYSFGIKVGVKYKFKRR